MNNPPRWSPIRHWALARTGVVTVTEVKPVLEPGGSS